MDYTVDGILQAIMLEWVAIPFSRESSHTRDQTQVSCIAGGFFINWAIREAIFLYTNNTKSERELKNQSHSPLQQKELNI